MNKVEANKLYCLIYGGTAAVLAVMHRCYWQPHDYSNVGCVVIGTLIGVAMRCWWDTWEFPEDVEDDNVPD